MNIRDLKYFVALADTNHFSKAAKACFVSQPSLSIQIKKLEKYLGVELFERTSRCVMLTDIGKIIVEQAKVLLQQSTLIQELAKHAQDPFSGELNLGVIPTIGPYLLPHLLPELIKTESFPKLSIYLTEQQTAPLILKVQAGELDAAVISLPIETNNLVVTPLLQEELYLAVPKKHRFAKQQSIKLSDLNNQSLLLLEDGHCLRDQVLAICKSAMAEKKFSAASIEVLKFMVGLNVGITIVPSLARNAENEICYLPFHNAKVKRTIGIIWRQSTPKRLLLEKMTEHILRLSRRLG